METRTCIAQGIKAHILINMPKKVRSLRVVRESKKWGDLSINNIPTPKKCKME